MSSPVILDSTLIVVPAAKDVRDPTNSNTKALIALLACILEMDGHLSQNAGTRATLFAQANSFMLEKAEHSTVQIKEQVAEIQAQIARQAHEALFMKIFSAITAAIGCLLAAATGGALAFVVSVALTSVMMSGALDKVTEQVGGSGSAGSLAVKIGLVVGCALLGGISNATTAVLTAIQAVTSTNIIQEGSADLLKACGTGSDKAENVSTWVGMAIGLALSVVSMKLVPSATAGGMGTFIAEKFPQLNLSPDVIRVIDKFTSSINNNFNPVGAGTRLSTYVAIPERLKQALDSFTLPMKQFSQGLNTMIQGSSLAAQLGEGGAGAALGETLLAQAATRKELASSTAEQQTILALFRSNEPFKSDNIQFTVQQMDQIKDTTSDLISSFSKEAESLTRAINQ